MRNTVSIVMSGLLAACASAPATQEQRETAEQRLLAPFLRDTQVECGELVVEMTANFYAAMSQPALDPQAHKARKERGEDFTETIWTNTLGAKKSAFVVTIGEPGRLTEKGLVLGPRTKFTVLNALRLRVYEGTKKMSLNAHATGTVVTVKEAAVAVPREVRAFHVVDGVVQMP
jgi:hypothetical protein